MSDSSPRPDTIFVRRGVDCAIAWPVIDSSGGPLDLTGWSAESQARRRAADTTPLHTWTTTNGGLLLQDGYVVMRMTGTETVDWAWESGVYDIILISPETRRYLVAEGGIALTETVTRVQP